MPLFVINAFDKADGLALRLSTRDAHVAHLNGSPEMKMAGPYLNAAGEPIGSLVVVEAADEAAARAFADRDPYARAGLFERVEIRPWRHTLGALP